MRNEIRGKCRDAEGIKKMDGKGLLSAGAVQFNVQGHLRRKKLSAP